MAKQGAVSGQDLDVLTAFIVKGPFGQVSMAELHCGYAEFCAERGARALDPELFVELLGRLTAKLMASQGVQ